MSLFKCKMCGGSLEVNAGESVVTCEYCGTQQTLPKLDDEKRANMYDRANHFRRNNEFDKAMAIYEQILNEDKTDAEAYWSIVLCRYGIEYVEDPSSHRRIPTVNRAQYTSILADEDYKSALANADTYQKSIYEIEAKAIDEIQKGILSISSKEEPFDVFICYKETDNNGRRTPDSVLAQELYYGLKNEGFKVFFARISLEDKLGSAYEPYIFAALNSAKVMVVLGTKSEFFNAVWVKNEWSRYLALIKQGQKKMLIPAYKDMDPYDLPEEFSHLQAQDMSKLGFMQDLIRGIKKIAGKEKKEPVKETVIVNQINQDHDTAPMLKRAFLFLEDGDFDSADEYAEKVLDIDPECSDAYIIKLLIDLKLRSASQISSYATPIDRNTNYIKALRFAKGDARNKIEGYNQAIVERIDLENKKQQYATACSLMSSRKYDEAIAAFSKIKTFKDSIDKIEACKQNKETDRKEAIYATALRDVASSSADDKAIKKSIAALETIKGYKDANTHIEKLQVRLEKWYEDKKKADERARIKAEQDKLEAARQAELRKIKAEQNKKKAIRIAKIGIPSLIALVLVVILTVTLFIPMIRFNKADKLFAAGKYDEAKRIYSELDGFGDSDKRISTVKAIDQIEDKKLEDGIKTLLAAGVPVELTYQTEGGSLTETQTLMFGYTLSLGTSVAPLSAETVTTTSEQNVFTFNVSADFTGLKIPGRNGYRFLEWVLDTYAYDVEAKDAKFCLTLKATWSTKDYVLEYDLAGGSISKSNVAEYDPEDESFTLINPTRIGYTFAGWTGTDLPGPTMEVTVPTGSYGDRNYTATWTANEYTVTYDAAGGTVSSETQTVAYDSNVEYLIPEREGCFKFIGWYKDSVLQQNGKWYLTSNVILIAKWEVAHKDIDKNHKCDVCADNVGAHVDDSNDGDHVCDYGCGVTLTNCNDTDKDHNCDECEVKIGMHADSANDRDHNCDYGCGEMLTICEDSNKDHACDECNIRMGTHADNSRDGDHACDYGCGMILTSCNDLDKNHCCDDCSITMGMHADRANDGDHICDYCGIKIEDCYDTNFDCVCEECGKSHNYVDNICTACRLYRNGKTVKFGSYPQTEVTDIGLKSTLMSKAGTLPTYLNSQSWTSYGYYISDNISNYMWYIDIEESEEKYRGVYFTSYRPYKISSSSSIDNTYQDDNGYISNTVYWFKYEPISWTILEENIIDGTALILCDMIVDSQSFDEVSNNYAESTIRKWLNETFYNTAFSELQKQIILTTTVNNSVASTGSSSNQYACENTNDKIFLLSRQEVANVTYGFESSTLRSDTARQKKTTDYAQSQGAHTSTEVDYAGNGVWWLRSPNGYYYDLEIGIGNNGSDNSGDYVYYTDKGVVPALYIRL